MNITLFKKEVLILFWLELDSEFRENSSYFIVTKNVKMHAFILKKVYCEMSQGLALC